MPISPYLGRLRSRVGTELILTPGVLALVRDEVGQVLVHRRSDNGAWVIPGGCTDPGETPAQTVIREVLEETGLLVRPHRLIAVAGGRPCRYPNGDELEMTVCLFDCRVVAGTLSCSDGEALELQWWPPDRIESVHLTNGLPTTVLDAVAGAWFEWDESWLDPSNSTATQPPGAYPTLDAARPHGRR